MAEVIKRKKARIEVNVQELGGEELEDRLASAAQQPLGQEAFAFSRKIAEEAMRRGAPLVVYEVCRQHPAETSEQLADRARKLVAAGADGIAVRMDEESTPEGEKDLFVVSRACAGVPVFGRDWFLHPLQIVDAKAAGATGIIGIVASVTARGSPVLSSFGAALGLDCPVEVVNGLELREMEESGVPFYCMGIQVGINVGITGFSKTLIEGTIGRLPRDSLSIVGVSSVEDVREMAHVGADAIYVKHDLVKLHLGEETRLVQMVRSELDE